MLAPHAEADQGCQRTTCAREVIAYVSPFSHPTNQYLENTRRGLSEAGYEVRPPSEIWKFKAWGGKKNRCIFLNWFEDRILRPQGRSRLFETLVFLYKLAAIRLQGVSIVWVRHNHRAHGQDIPDWIASRVLGLLGRMSHATVVHSRRAALEHRFSYLPHPLYRVRHGHQTEHLAKEVPDLNRRVAVLGQLRESKGIDAMLRQWPAEQPLILAGKPVTPDYDKVIRRIIDERGLDACTIFRNLDSDEFDYLLGNCQSIYIANPPETMIVSGVFFHAASVGTPVVLKRSNFAEEVAEECDFAVVIDRVEDIASATDRCSNLGSEAIISQADALYGQVAYADRLKELFEEIQPCHSR